MLCLYLLVVMDAVSSDNVKPRGLYNVNLGQLFTKKCCTFQPKWVACYARCEACISEMPGKKHLVLRCLPFRSSLLPFPQDKQGHAGRNDIQGSVGTAARSHQADSTHASGVHRAEPTEVVHWHWVSALLLIDSHSWHFPWNCSETACCGTGGMLVL